MARAMRWRVGALWLFTCALVLYACLDRDDAADAPAASDREVAPDDGKLHITDISAAEVSPGEAIVVEIAGALPDGPVEATVGGDPAEVLSRRHGAIVVKVPPDPVSRDIKGVAKGVGGALEIDPYDVSRTRGDVAVDLTTLEAHGFGDERLDAEVTAHARDFLEVGKGSLKEPVRFARFAIKSIDDASERNVMPLPGDKRTVTLKATGDLEIHGIKQEKQVELVASFTVSGAEK